MTSMRDQIVIALTPFIHHGIATAEEAADAVLGAMREPTIEMILSCADVPWSQQDMWKRSIDAASSDISDRSLDVL